MGKETGWRREKGLKDFFTYLLTYLLNPLRVLEHIRLPQGISILSYSVLFSQLTTRFHTPSPCSFWSSWFPLSWWCPFQYSLCISVVPHSQYMSNVSPFPSLDFCYDVTYSCSFCYLSVWYQLRHLPANSRTLLSICLLVLRVSAPYNSTDLTLLTYNLIFVLLEIFLLFQMFLTFLNAPASFLIRMFPSSLMLPSAFTVLPRKKKN